VLFRSRNQNMVTIAKTVSDLVVQGRSSYFPILYGSTNCRQAVNNSGRTYRNALILFSEIAHSDLYNYAMRLTISQLNEVVLQVLYGIRDLQIHCNIVHNHLHLGNILLLRNPKRYPVHILINGFSRSFKIQEKLLNHRASKKDILTFLGCIVDLRRDKGYLHQKLDRAVEITKMSTSNYPIIEVISFWEKKF
jgi:hypothetical protein